jgi:hypothetical protein
VLRGVGQQVDFQALCQQHLHLERSSRRDRRWPAMLAKTT